MRHTKGFDEIEAKLAKEVMGWSLFVPGPNSLDPDQHYWKRGHRDLIKVEEWWPSTDLETAWQVVEKLVAKSGYEDFELYRCADGTWSCTFASWIGAQNAFTPELAICLAALKTI